MTKDEALNYALQLVSNLRTHSWTVADTQFVITAIKEALAQPWEKFCDSNCVWTDHHPDCKMAQPEPVANGKLKVTLQDTPTEIELAQYKKMLQAACADLGAINEALGLDPNDGGAESILFAIEELRGRSQEPMAWMVYTLDGTSVCVTDNPKSFTPEHRALPLYTTPPQRRWVGLTKKEFQEAVEGLEDLEDCWVAIESALRSKNHG